MINTEFMGSFLEGAAWSWGDCMGKKSEEPKNKRGASPLPIHGAAC